MHSAKFYCIHVFCTFDALDSWVSVPSNCRAPLPLTGQTLEFRDRRRALRRMLGLRRVCPTDAIAVAADEPLLLQVDG